MFSRHFQRVMTYLREEGGEYARMNPASAGHLWESSGDQDVERLLEGFAFLSAKLHERADDAVPEIVHQLALLLEPQYLRPTPACTIVQIESALTGQRARLRVPAGTQLASTPIDHEGTQCVFRTTHDVELLPIEIAGFELDRARTREPVLRLRLRADATGRRLLFDRGGLSLYLAGDLPLTTTLLLWLLHYCDKITIRGRGGSIELPASSLVASGLDATRPMLDWPAEASAGLRAVQEYFTLTSRFLFVELRNLERAATLEDSVFDDDVVVVELGCPGAPTLPAPVSATNIRLGCSPAINLFTTPATPVRWTPTDGAQLLLADGLTPANAEVYRVDSVVGVRPGRATRTPYRQFTSFDHTQTIHGEHLYYALDRRASLTHAGHDSYIRVLGPRDQAPTLTREVLSIELTCTNRDAPTRLDVGDICRPTGATPSSLRFRNITRVTRPARCPLASELQWRMISHLALNHRSLIDAERLRELLSIYNLQRDTDSLAGSTNERRIASIRKVELEPRIHLVERLPVRGSRTTIHCDADGFECAGDAYLFGAVLDQLFADLLPINSFNALRLILHPALTEYTWTPRSGLRSLL